MTDVNDLLKRSKDALERWPEDAKPSVLIDLRKHLDSLKQGSALHHGERPQCAHDCLCKQLAVATIQSRVLSRLDSLEERMSAHEQGMCETSPPARLTRLEGVVRDVSKALAVLIRMERDKCRTKGGRAAYTALLRDLKEADRMSDHAERNEYRDWANDGKDDRIEVLQAEVQRLTEGRDPHEHCRGTAACAQGDDLCVAFPASVYAEFDRLTEERDATEKIHAAITKACNANVADLRAALAAKDDALNRLAYEPAQFGEHEVYAPDWVRAVARTALGATQR